MEASKDASKTEDVKSIFESDIDTFLETLAKAKVDLESLSMNISQGLARCEILCDAEGVPYDYRILSANEAFEKHTGINRDFIVSKTILEAYPDVEKSWIDTYGRVALTQKTEVITGYNHNTKRHYRSVAYSDKHGEFMMLFEDTTHQIELEKAYQLVLNSTKLNAALLDNLQEGFMHCRLDFDSEGQPIDFTILSVNDAFVEQTEIEKSSLVGRRILEVFPEMKPSKLAKYCEVGISGISDNFIDHCDYTGKIFDISSFSPRPKEFIWIIRDITKKEKDRLELQNAYQKAEESERLKSAFLANMSHEIRTPLNAILGFTELLGDGDLDQEEEKKCLNNIKGAGNRLLTIVSDILDLSKLEANQQKLRFKLHNLNEIIDRLSEQFNVINTNTTLKISTFKDLEDKNALIETDATRLEQIISNLLENALKHTKTGFIRFGYRVKDSFLEFFVEDSGVGISESDQNLIFKRFGQVNTKTKVNQGTGLGLTIAQGFSQLFGGKMWVKSEIDQGSTFYFTIPYLPKENENGSSKKPTILVAEDEEVNFQLLQLWLKKHCNLIHASDGHKTIALAMENTDIDLILMDIKMPYLNGIEATKEIRKTNEDIPIIAQTAFIMDEEREEILAAGSNEIVSKPIQREEFKKLLTKYIPYLKFA